MLLNGYKLQLPCSRVTNTYRGAGDPKYFCLCIYVAAVEMPGEKVYRVTQGKIPGSTTVTFLSYIFGSKPYFKNKGEHLFTNFIKVQLNDNRWTQEAFTKKDYDKALTSGEVKQVFRNEYNRATKANGEDGATAMPLFSVTLWEAEDLVNLYAKLGAEEESETTM